MKSLNDLITTENFNPTDEQAKVIRASENGDSLVCVARAGTGKTATASAVAHHVNKPGYFLVFNKAARHDAKSRFPAIVEPVTGHSFAFQRVIERSRGYQRKLAPELDHTSGRLSPAVIERFLNLSPQPQWFIDAPRAMAIAIFETIKAFQSSARRTLCPELVPENVIPVELRLAHPTIEHRKREFIHEVCRLSETMWRAMIDEYNDAPIQHDTYLKMLQLRQDPVETELWLLDEYQDTVPVVADLINQQGGQKIYIGDPCQAIYGWRGAINALDEPQNWHPTFYLTNSFRFNHQVAQMASLLLRGVGEKQAVRGQPENLRQFNYHERHTRLVRNNITMLPVALECMRTQQPVYVPGGLTREVRTKIQSAYALYAGIMDEVKIGALQKMGSWGAFREFSAQQPNNSEYQTLIELVERLGSASLDVIKYIDRHHEYDADKASRQITLITAHRAKGREWPMVSISDDLALSQPIMDKLLNGAPLDPGEREQVNLLYVAITRAARGIDLKPKVKNTLTQLHKAFSLPDDTPDRFVADSSARTKRSRSPEDIRQRTEEFIRRAKAHQQS